MKKSLVLLAGCLFILISSAQGSSSKFSIGFFISPNIASRSLTAEEGYPYPQLVGITNDFEVPKLGYSAGITAAYLLHKKIKLQTGIIFSNNGYRDKKQDPLRWENQFDSTGYNPALPSGELITGAAFVHNYYYLDIPLQVKYTFLKKKIELYVIGGLETNFNVANNYIVIKWYEDGHKEREKYKHETRDYEYRKFNFSGTAGMGLDINLSSKFTLFVQPTFRYMFLPIMDSPFRRKLYSAELAMGVNISL